MLLKELNYATGVGIFNLAAKIEFIVLKDEVEKLDIKKSGNIPTGLNNLKTNIDHIDVGKTVFVDLKKVSDRCS